MDHINKHLSKASQKEPQPLEKTMSNKMMVNLWERLNHIYGHRFSSAYGVAAYDESGITEAAKTWASGLRGVSGNQVANGLRECVDCGEAWPPTLPEFVLMCKGIIKNRFGLTYVPECYRDAPIVDESKLLSSDQVKKSRESGRSELDKMREVLRGR